MSDISYNPACSICRDLAGKDRAGVEDWALCLPHLRSEHDRLESRVRELEAEQESYRNTANTLAERVASAEAERDRLNGYIESWCKAFFSESNRADTLLNENNNLRAERDRLNNDLLDVLDIKHGHGPTALSMVISDRDELRARHAALVEKANHAYSEWEGGSHEQEINAMREFGKFLFALAEVKG
jgi:chromosome segregation ATPase